MCIFRKCIYPKSVFAKCTRIVCLLSFVSLFYAQVSFFIFFSSPLLLQPLGNPEPMPYCKDHEAGDDHQSHGNYRDHPALKNWKGSFWFRTRRLSAAGTKRLFQVAISRCGSPELSRPTMRWKRVYLMTKMTQLTQDDSIILELIQDIAYLSCQCPEAN